MTPSADPHRYVPLGDPLMDPRLERIAARSAAARARLSTDPPPIGDPASAWSRPPSTPLRAGPPTASAGKPAAANNGPNRARRRHAAKGSRSAALALSVTTTIGLAGFLQRLDAAGAESNQAGDTTSSALATSDSALATAPIAEVDSVAGVAGVAGVAASPEVAPVVAAVDPVVPIDSIEPVATVAAPVVAGTEPATPVAPVEPVASVAPQVAVVDEVAGDSSGLFDGTYSGGVFRNKWGVVQVEITISGGTLVDVTTLQFPDDDRKSVQINNRALPRLASSALTAQSADINTVSGATYTSDDYRQSLQSALDAATAAALN